jgi:GNAT superfamily N-acetyltransferase
MFQPAGDQLPSDFDCRMAHQFCWSQITGSGSTRQLQADDAIDRKATLVAYRFSVESTVYVAQGCAGQGMGSRLYNTLIEDLRARGIPTLL